MQTKAKAIGHLEAENADLRQQLAEAREALDAIRRGDVDALVVERPEGPQVFTLTGADTPYRVMVEEMQEGAVTLSDAGVIVYCNKQIARLLGVRPGPAGPAVPRLSSPRKPCVIPALWQRSGSEADRGEVSLLAAGGAQVPVYLALRPLPGDGLVQTSVVIADLTQQKRHQEIMASEVFSTSILDQAQDAIVVCDPSGRVIRANQAAELLGGANPLLQPFYAAFPLRRAIEAGPADPLRCGTVVNPPASGVHFLRGVEASRPARTVGGSKCCSAPASCSISIERRWARLSR